ncbi:MAG: ISLre2 family transposase, partial [Methanomicrobium sp.]|nr:ISLre2 family transposase [Methanomicrobium sp.]
MERKIFEYGCGVAKNVLKEGLQELDRQLMKSRDKSVYRHKGHRKTCIKTLMGEVEYSRAVYEVLGTSEKKFVYLLDEYMKFDCIGFVSANLAEKIANGVCEASYAETAKNVTDLTGQSISHTGVWNVIQKLGTKIEQREDRLVELNKSKELHGKRETKVLFEEADGVFVKLQKRYSNGKKSLSEIKLSMFHEGWKKTGANRYEAYNKNVVCSCGSGIDLKNRKEALISKTYNTDEIEMRMFNSDGGAWIKRLYEYDDAVEFQLDPFHVRKAIRESSPGGEYEKNILKYIENKNIEGMLDYIDAAANSLDNPKAEEKLRKLYQYLLRNKKGLIPLKNRVLSLPKLNGDLEYRTMGNCEHNVYLSVAKRLKHRCAAWSPQGSINLCKILCLKVGHKLSGGLDEVTSLALPEKFTQIIKYEILSSSKVKEKFGKGYEGRHTSLPFENAAVSNGR